MQARSKGIELAEEAKVGAFETLGNIARERKKGTLKVDHIFRQISWRDEI
jgi:hypothetical protein